jgi:hypothetical protein
LLQQLLAVLVVVLVACMLVACMLVACMLVAAWALLLLCCYVVPFIF